MNFKRYTSIDNSSRKLTLDHYVLRGYTDGEWIVTTKIHGSNLSFLCDKNEIKCAKRSGLIKGNFFRYEKVLDRYKDNIEKLRELVQSYFDFDDCSIQLFGEIFGGHYPHPDVEEVADVRKVQPKVWYCPDVDFYPFDIYVEHNGQRFPLDYDVFEKLIKESGFTLYAKAIFRGKFEDCLAYPNEYLDPIHKHYGLPEIDNNICEGNVLKPVKAMCDPTGSRIILKNKNEKFTERESSKEKIKVEIVISDKAKKAVEIGDQYITENRLRNVISHIGEVTQKDFGLLMNKMSYDVRQDMVKDDPNIFEEIEKKEVRHINKIMNKSISHLIRANFVNIVDGTF